MQTVAESTLSALIFGPYTVSNTWNHWLFINRTAYIDQSDDRFYAHVEKTEWQRFVYLPAAIYYWGLIWRQIRRI